jgi:hypothetical protein
MESKNTNSLKHLMNEVMSEKHTIQRIKDVKKSTITLDERAINALINSRVFTLNEQKAMRILFSKTKTKTLTENTIKILDENVRVISKSNEIDIRLKEGFFSDIWDGLKSLGDKAKEAITGGWSKVKAIWGQFKALVQEVINSAKNGLLKLCNMGRNVGNVGEEAMSKLKDKKIVADPDFVKELKQLGETGKWWKDSWFQKWVSAPFWEKDVLAGNGTVDDEPKVDTKAAEQGLQTIAAMESLISKRNSLLSDYHVVSELLKLSRKQSNLNEGGSVEHLDDAIKNPALKKIVHYAIELIQWVFIPFAKLGQVAASWVGPKLLSGFSTATKTVGGPGTYPFQLLGTLFGEIVEIYVKSKTGSMTVEFVANTLFPGVGIAVSIVESIHTALFCWTVANILINLVEVADKQKAEGFASNGKFKIKEGNLLFVKTSRGKV